MLEMLHIVAKATLLKGTSYHCIVPETKRLVDTCVITVTFITVQSPLSVSKAHTVYNMLVGSIKLYSVITKYSLNM